MPPKVDPNEIRIIRIKVFGGEGGPASTLAPKLGPLGLNAKKIGEDIIKESSKLKGIRQMIELKVQNRAAEIYMVPTTSALLIKELGVRVSLSRKHPGTGKKPKILNMREISLSSRLRKLLESLNINHCPELSMEL